MAIYMGHEEAATGSTLKGIRITENADPLEGKDMGFRFRKSIRIAPGIRINISKSELSTSIGRRGLTWNSRGSFTAGIPGTGISYRANLNKKGTAKSSLAVAGLPENTQAVLTPAEIQKRNIARFWIVSITGLIVLTLFFPLLLIPICLIPITWMVVGEMRYRNNR